MFLSFPEDFMWGTATASYQIEGCSYAEGEKEGRGLSIWDTFSHTKGKISNGDNGDISCDHYHLYKDDIKLMKSYGLKHYRFSISWSRLLPNGNISYINPKGVEFYNNIINELIKYDIQPIITIYHWDLPLNLHIEYDGWLNGKYIINEFDEYARLCFKLFGDRVKMWFTFNEPWVIAVIGYGNGKYAPGRKIYPRTEPYIVAHNILLAHAKVVETYRNEFKDKQNGIIGIVLNSDWREPKTDSLQDKEAAERSLLFTLGWFADVIFKTGDYPQIMKERVGKRLPEFTENEKKLLKGSSDFFGLNHYGSALTEPSNFCMSDINKCNDDESFFIDEGTKISDDPKWEKTDMGWNIVPDGIFKLLNWINERYKPNGGIYITENGCAIENKDDFKKDFRRIKFIGSYLAQVHKAIKNGVDVKGYFVWSFMDNFEWSCGYTQRFGITYINYETKERVQKYSAKFYKSIVQQNGLNIDDFKNENEENLYKILDM